MRSSGTGLKVFLLFLIFMALTALLVGCGASKVNTSSDNGAKVEQPATGSQEQAKKTEPQSPTNFEKLLTPADVAAVSGYQGVKTIPYNPQIYAGGKLNFVFDTDKLVLAVMVEDESMFSHWKKSKDLNALAVANLGDEAFQGVADSNTITPNVTFRKGDTSIQLFTFFNMEDNMKPYLNHEQLIKLAKIIEGRM